MNLFEGRKLLIATKHKKETVIASLVEQELKVKVFVPLDYDTDQFGTFSGEISRKKDAIETLKDKCLKALDVYGYDLGIASEGSFGPHPSLFFASADDELILLIDKKNNLEIIARELSLETNFNAEQISTYGELKEFATKNKFPSHGIILKDSQENCTISYKDITSWESLQAAYESLRLNSSSCYVETDMRAHRNPTRMSVIKVATQKLLKKINSLCPNCQIPGYDVEEVISGLPCEWCKQPTNSTLAYRYQCKKCEYSSAQKFPNDKYYESPEFCSYCNP
jgi:hypothetical protein